MEETGIPVIVAEDPLTCVARGGGKALEMIDTHGGDSYLAKINIIVRVREKGFPLNHNITILTPVLYFSV